MKNLNNLLQSNTNINELNLKYQCKQAPSISTFYLLFYDDPFFNSLHEVWRIFVHALKRWAIFPTSHFTRWLFLWDQFFWRTRQLRLWPVFMDGVLSYFVYCGYHACLSIDVNCLLGQPSAASLVLRGMSSSRTVTCYTSHPLELQVKDAWLQCVLERTKSTITSS